MFRRRPWGASGHAAFTHDAPPPPAPLACRGGTQCWSAALTATSSPTTPTSMRRAAACTSSPVGPPLPRHTGFPLPMIGAPGHPEQPVRLSSLPLPCSPSSFYPSRAYHGWKDNISEAGGCGAPDKVQVPQAATEHNRPTFLPSSVKFRRLWRWPLCAKCMSSPALPHLSSPPPTFLLPRLL